MDILRVSYPKKSSSTNDHDNDDEEVGTEDANRRYYLKVQL